MISQWKFTKYQVAPRLRPHLALPGTHACPLAQRFPLPEQRFGVTFLIIMIAVDNTSHLNITHHALQHPVFSYQTFFSPLSPKTILVINIFHKMVLRII